MREKSLAEQVYSQAATDRESAVARELEETPTVVVQDPLPPVLPKVRKHLALKVVISGVVSFVLICLAVLITDFTKRRLEDSDTESERFRRAVSTLPGMRRKSLARVDGNS